MSMRFPSCFCNVSLVLILGLLSACDTQDPAALPPEPPVDVCGNPLAAAPTEQTPLTGKIVFSSKRSGRYQLYTINPDGSDLRQLTFGTYSSYIPRWSPDGQQIVFTSDSLGSTAGSPLYLMNADGTDIRALKVLRVIDEYPDLQLGYVPAWSPDGTKIAFAHYQEILVYDFATDQVRALTNDLRRNNKPSWSPDGTKITFVSDREQGENTEEFFLELYIMDADGGNQQRMTFEQATINMPTWSPDGKQIAFALDGQLSLFHLACEAFSPLDVSISGERLPTPVAWSPDGTRLLVISTEKRPYIVDVKREHLTLLLDDDEVSFADWSIN